MKKITYTLGLSLALLACTLYLSSCSAEPVAAAFETVEEDTRASMALDDYLPRLPYLHVNYVNRSLIQLRWLHNYSGAYDYIYIYRGDRPVNLKNPPTVTLTMGTDPFAYDFMFDYMHTQRIPLEIVGYKDYYYQVLGFCLSEMSASEKSSIVWATQEVVIPEPIYRGIGDQTE